MGYTPRNLERLSPDNLADLESLGFNLPHRSSTSDGLSAEPSGIPVNEEDWEISIPCQKDSDRLTEFLRGMYRRIHALKVRFGRREVHLAEEGLSDPASAPLLASMHAWQEEVEQLLQGESAWRESQGDLEFQARSIPRVAEVDQPVPNSGLLHTRLVSNDEVRENLYSWREAMAAEYQSLLSKGAIEPVPEDQVQSWIANGEDVEVLPGRGVASEKPQEGQGPRKKYRAVICGNFQAPHPDRAKETLYAGGADSVSLRTCLRWAGLRQAGASVVDVKTAFLNAPVDESEARFLICNPPRHMILAGVVPSGTRWRVHGALYGLLTSPRAWSKERDGRMRKFRWTCQGSSRRLLQCITESPIPMYGVWLMNTIRCWV